MTVETMLKQATPPAFIGLELCCPQRCGRRTNVGMRTAALTGAQLFGATWTDGRTNPDWWVDNLSRSNATTKPVS
jgi:hypothetical protein